MISGTQAVAHAIIAQKLADKEFYTDEFKKNIVGKAPVDASNENYPMNKQARHCAKILSKV